MSTPRRERAVPIALSVLAHLVVVAILTMGLWHFRSPPPPPQSVAIEGTLVNNSAPPATAPDPTPDPTPVTPDPTPTPTPTPPEPVPEPQQDVAAQRQLEAQQAAEQREAELRAQASRQEQTKATIQAANKKAAAAAKAAEEKDKKARAAALVKQQQDAAKRKQDDARQQADHDKAEREKAQAAAELRNQLAAEEHLNAVTASGELAKYKAMIQARVVGAWIRPPTARAGLDCVIRVTQVPGGAVVSVQLGSCNGDDAVRQSIEAAVYRASPLPAPPDPSLFDRNLSFNFKPSD